MTLTGCAPSVPDGGVVFSIWGCMLEQGDAMSPIPIVLAF